MSGKQFKEILDSLKSLKEEFENISVKLDELYSQFDSIDFEPEEENEEIEEKIEKLESALEALDEEDDEMKERLEKKIEALREASGGIDETGDLISQIEELFSEIKETAENLNLN